MTKVKSKVYDESAGRMGNRLFYQTPAGTIMASIPQPSDPKSPAQQDVRSRFRDSVMGYATLSQEQHRGWIALGKQMTLTNKGMKRKALGGQACYNSLNTRRLAMGVEALSDAPLFPELAPSLPALTLSATRSGTPDGQLVLTIEAAAAYNGCLVQIWTTPPLRPTVHSIPSGKYQVTEYAVNLPAAPLDVSSGYLRLHAAPPVGTKVAVRLVPVTASGFAGMEVELTTLVTLD